MKMVIKLVHSYKVIYINMHERKISPDAGHPELLCDWMPVNIIQ